MTTPSIRETLLTFARDLPRASSAARDEADHIEDELSQLPALGFTQARRLLTDRRRELVDYATAMEAAAITRVALILGLRTGKDGECNIDKPPIWPKGPPTKAESAARGNAESGPPADPPASETPVETGTTAPEDAPPDDDASGLAAAFATANEWASCDAGKARGHAISVLGYTANELVGLGDVQIRAICKHRVGPDEYGGVAFGGVMVDGVTWLLEAPARVVAS